MDCKRNVESGVYAIPDGPGLKFCPIKMGYALRYSSCRNQPQLLCDTCKCAWWDEKRQECGQKRV